MPFENLDIFLGRKISIDEDAFVCKVVEARRGGFCYELNGAFAALLRTNGFQVTLLSARVAREDGTYSLDYDHLALIIDLDQRWLADVGFGENFLEPLMLDDDVEQHQSEGTYCVRERDELWTVERLQTDELWKPVYSFAPRALEAQDFAARCHFHQTSPESHLTQKRLCTLATPNRADHTQRSEIDRHGERSQTKPVASLRRRVARSITRTLWSDRLTEGEAPLFIILYIKRIKVLKSNHIGNLLPK